VYRVHLNKSIRIETPATAFDPSVDLVAKDLRETPMVLTAVDKAWAKSTSPECIAAKTLIEALQVCMKMRKEHMTDTTDLLIGGVEASLWVAEQFATDLRFTFPNLSINTVSANKLLGIGEHETGKIIDAGVPYKLSPNTCVLLISQSGQTFPTLHATRQIANVVKERLWILTGCRNSKMEKVHTLIYCLCTTVFESLTVIYTVK